MSQKKIFLLGRWISGSIVVKIFTLVDYFVNLDVLSLRRIRVIKKECTKQKDSLLIHCPICWDMQIFLIGDKLDCSQCACQLS